MNTNYTPVQMAPEQKFYLAIAKVAASTFFCMLAGIMGNDAYTKWLKLEMVKAGKNPAEVSCAFK